MSTNNNNNKADVDQSWDDVISTTRVVATRSEALACVRGPSPGNKKTFAWKSIQEFWHWHLPLLALAILALEIVQMFVMLTSWLLFDWKMEDGSNINWTTPATSTHVTDLIDFLWASGVSSQSFSNDEGMMTFMFAMMACCRVAFGVLGRLILVTVILIILLISQRLSWRTTELGTFSSVKDDVRYQDEQLLNKAWNMAFQHQGYKDPTQYSDYTEGVGGGAIVMQPCPGYCGIATLNSTLRSFGGSGGSSGRTANGVDATTAVGQENNAPYLSLPSHTRYVTLEEMCKLIQEKVINSTSSSTGSTYSSEWERGGGGRVDSMQVIGGGGGSKEGGGLACLEQFKAALRQLSHPTQPARIMAIYHRSPLFFCSQDKSLISKLACFPMVHWSPVLAYLEEEDLVLVMDVNHMYGPKGYLVSTQRFFDAVNTRDIFNGNYHGLILLRPPPKNGTMLPSLVTSPRDLSVVFGNIKQAYYRHQAAGRKVSAAEILESNEDGFNPLQDNEHGEKSIRLVTIDDGDNASTAESGVSAVISAHPIFFANEIFLDTGRVPSDDAIRTMINVFTKLRVPPRVAVRGFDVSTANSVHRILTASGMVQLIKPTKVAFLNLEPSPKNSKTSTEKLPQGYYIQEIIFHPDKSGQHSPAVADLGKLIVESYKFPNIFRRGQTPSDFYAQAYQTFEHGGGDGKELRHFGCYESESGTLASCVALFCCNGGSSGEKYGTRPDVAAIYNVCTSPTHRHKGLGKTMTLHALEVAKKMGCKQIVLEASSAGQPLYESMGFVVVEEPVGGIYISISSATDDFKWKNGFRLLELYYRVKNGGMWYYYEEVMRQIGIKRRR